jgi:hypothetical protein
MKQEKKPTGRDILFSINSNIGASVGKQTINLGSLINQDNYNVKQLYTRRNLWWNKLWNDKTHFLFIICFV